jgi:TrmH family RNA methyltransferase
VQVLAGVPHVGQPLFESDLRRPTAFLVGGEGSGLSVALVQRADGALSIPMRAPVESLNVAVAAALLLYEAARQRATLGSRL